MTIDYSKLTDQYFKAAGSPVDLYAATLGREIWITGSG
jgi:hypothetical protein